MKMQSPTTLYRERKKSLQLSSIYFTVISHEYQRETRVYGLAPPLAYVNII